MGQIDYEKQSRQKLFKFKQKMGMMKCTIPPKKVPCFDRNALFAENGKDALPTEATTSRSKLEVLMREQFGVI